MKRRGIIPETIAYAQSGWGVTTFFAAAVLSTSLFLAAGWTTIMVMVVVFVLGTDVTVVLVRERLRQTRSERIANAKRKADLEELHYQKSLELARKDVDKKQLSGRLKIDPEIVRLAGMAPHAHETEKLPAVTTRLPEATSNFRGPETSKLPVKYQTKEPFIKWATKTENWYRPYLSEVIGKAILGIGMRGSGKTNAAAVFIEQLCGIGPIPAVVFDLMDDYSSLREVVSDCVIGGASDWRSAWQHRGHYWEINEENAQECGYDVLEEGWRLVVALGSYKDRNQAAMIMVKVLEGMFEWAQDKLSGKDRVPCLVFLDEAQQFLPQNRGGRLDKDAYDAVLTMFSRVNEVGRKLGFTPALFTQRIATIHNDVIEGSEIYVFMKQDLQADIKKYEEYLGKEIGSRQNIESLQPGEGYVKTGDKKFKVKFDMRESEHKGVTPGLEQALQRYQNKKRVVGDRVSSWVEEEDVHVEGAYEGRDTDPLEDAMDDYTPPDYQETVKQPIAQPVVKPKTDLEKVVEFFTAHPDTSCRAAGDNKLISGFGRSKVNELYKLAVEQGLLPTRDRVLSE